MLLLSFLSLSTPSVPASQEPASLSSAPLSILTLAPVAEIGAEHTLAPSTTMFVLAQNGYQATYCRLWGRWVTFPPDDELKLSRHQGVQADVEQVQTSLLQFRQQPHQVHSIGGHSNGLQALQLPQLRWTDRWTNRQVIN